jgi:hypothetical protein
MADHGNLAGPGLPLAVILLPRPLTAQIRWLCSANCPRWLAQKKGHLPGGAGGWRKVSLTCGQAGWGREEGGKHSVGGLMKVGGQPSMAKSTRCPSLYRFGSSPYKAIAMPSGSCEKGISTTCCKIESFFQTPLLGAWQPAWPFARNRSDSCKIDCGGWKNARASDLAWVSASNAKGQCRQKTLFPCKDLLMQFPLGKLEYLYVGTAAFDRDLVYYRDVLGARGFQGRPQLWESD